MFPDPLRFLIGTLVLFAVFSLLNQLRSKDQRLPLLRRGFWTDLAYWIFTPFIAKAMTKVAVALAILPIALLAYGGFLYRSRETRLWPSVSITLLAAGDRDTRAGGLYWLLDASRVSWCAPVGFSCGTP